MRIKAYVGDKSPIYEMANGASEPIGYINANSFITIIGVKKDGLTSYYRTNEYDGFIKKTNIQFLRDEEFFSASTLIKKKQNRSKRNRYNTMRQNIAASSWSYGSDPMISGGGKGWAGGVSQGNRIGETNSMSDSWNSSGTSIIPKYQGSAQPMHPINSTGPKPVTPMQTIAGVAAGFLGNGKLGVIGSAGSAMLSSFASTGNWNAVNNMGLGGFLGNGIMGQLFNGATISNIADGSFFKTALLQNAMNLIGSILGTLFQKLDYVVGFNLSGSLLGLFNGFARYNHTGLTTTLYGDSTRIPSRLTLSGDLDERIRKYFKYKGDANYQMKSHGPSELLGSAIYGPIDYRTPTLNPPEPDSKQVEFHRKMFNDLYTDFADNLKRVRDSVNLNIERADWFYNFNRFRLIHPNSVLANSKGYIFFTRPDLNLVSPSGATSDIGLLINIMAQQHPAIVAGLQKSPSMSGATFDNAHKFIPLLSNRCTGIDINDEQLETKEVNDTYTGWKLNYGTTTIKSKAAGQVTTSFIDDEQLSIYLTFKLWEEYISNVSRGIIDPQNTYIKTLQLDYANSIYYFLTAEDGQSIIFWTKFTGCIPTNIPSSNFADNIDSPIRLPKYSITWQYAFKHDYDPYTLSEFNNLANGGNFEAMPMYDSETIRSARTIVGSPYIDTKTGGRLYRLLFRKAANSFGT